MLNAAMAVVIHLARFARDRNRGPSVYSLVPAATCQDSLIPYRKFFTALVLRDLASEASDCNSASLFGGPDRVQCVLRFGVCRCPCRRYAGGIVCPEETCRACKYVSCLTALRLVFYLTCSYARRIVLWAAECRYAGGHVRCILQPFTMGQSSGASSSFEGSVWLVLNGVTVRSGC